MKNLKPIAHDADAASWRWPWFSLAVAVTAILIHALDASVRLQFDRDLIYNEPWRGFACHLTHFSGEHLGWDLALWLAFGAWAEQISRTRSVAAVSAAATAITLGVLFLQPQFLVYRGLSGLDSAAFTFVVGHLFLLSRRRGDRQLALVTGIAFIGFFAKCTYETAVGAAVFVSSDGFEPVALAHLIGGSCGLIGVCFMRTSGPGRVTARGRVRSAIGAANG